MSQILTSLELIIIPKKKANNMPFQSEKQRRFLSKFKPEIAKEFAKKTIEKFSKKHNSSHPVVPKSK